jgi:16S rRNA (cytosine967-C5)-methyltransferase
VVAADAAAPPFVPGSFDRVLVDAPCSGLGTLRRRPDARWRIDADAPERLAALQRRLVDASAELLRPGGHLVYSVCTLTDAETLAIDDHLAGARPDLQPVPPPGDPWRPHGRGARLLPQAADTDGMYLLHLQRPA